MNVRWLLILVPITIALSACKGSDSLTSPSPAASDSALTGYWEIVDSKSIDNQQVPFRMRFSINRIGLEELQYCALGGKHGFGNPARFGGAREFEIEINARENTSFQATVTKVEADRLVLNDKYVFRRFTPPGNKPLLATDAANGLCLTLSQL